MLRFHVLTILWLAVSVALMPVAITGAIAAFLPGYDLPYPGLPQLHPLFFAFINVVGFGVPAVLGLAIGWWAGRGLSLDPLPEGSSLPMLLRAGSAFCALGALFSVLWGIVSGAIFWWFGPQIPIVEMSPASLMIGAGGCLAFCCFLGVWAVGLHRLAGRLAAP